MLKGDARERLGGASQMDSLAVIDATSLDHFTFLTEKKKNLSTIKGKESCKCVTFGK